MVRTKVVHIITKLELGGAQLNTLFTVANLNSNRFEPVLISGTEGGLVKDAQRLANVKVFLIPELVREIQPFKDLKAFFKIRKILKLLKKDEDTRDMSQYHHSIIVHTHSSKAGIIGRWAAYFSGIKIIIHSVHGFSFNGYQTPCLRAFYLLLEKITSRVTTKFITVSKSDMDMGGEKKVFTKDKVVLIRSGIDVEGFKKLKRGKKGKPVSGAVNGGRPLVAMIACFKPQKSPLDFVKVAKRVSDEVGEVHFLLVGDGMLRDKVEKLIETLNMKGRICLLGWRRDIPEIMGSINVLVHTSLWEGLPQVFPQAMAAGVPIVATAVNGAPEVIAEGVNGFLLPPGDIQGIAEKVVYLLRHPEEASEMGKKGRRLADEFDRKTMVEQQEILYTNLLAQSRAVGLYE